MAKKKAVNLKLKVYVTGYYINKQGKKRYGFVKRDARKKDQIIWVKDLKTRARYKLPVLTKKQFKGFKKQFSKYLEKGFKTFRGKKIEKVSREIKTITMPVSKPFEIKFDKGKYNRIETMQRVDTIEELEVVFYSGFSQGKILKAKIVVPSITLQVSFKSKQHGSNIVYMFVWARRIDVNLKSGSIAELLNQITKRIDDLIDEIMQSYSTIITDIKFEIKLHWLIEKDNATEKK